MADLQTGKKNRQESMRHAAGVTAWRFADHTDAGQQVKYGELPHRKDHHERRSD
ncbi:MAG: hypothetical protein LKF52_08995 [Butyrivibrio sp.]|jgi:hypothetical protein|nr:hypothetical protein [Butyrivibrio sp.]